MDEKQIIEAVKEAKEKSKKRGFNQSLEIGINLKDVKLEGADKINTSIKLPNGRGRDIEVGVFAEGDLNMKAKKYSKHVLNKEEIEEYAKDRRKMKKFAGECYGLIAQPDLMSIIGKKWGIILGPRNKMPQIMPPNKDVKEYIKDLKNTVRVKSKKNPTIHVPVGTEDMEDQKLAENIQAVYTGIERTIPVEKIANIYCKTTMGPAVKIKW
ncbi:MAG: 50S ribosomal protein L1 [Candidatus Altiarchaeales archaeon ex4484_2]|nr:MAG: 50S ribosomal protein L1 [Candidatus Altiarchaeales archaeon ex4484_2]